MKFTCRACEAENESYAALSRHLKKDHGIATKEYFPLFYDRRDLYDGELIAFKDVNQYFDTYFNSKYNMDKWCENDSDEVRAFVMNILKNRAAKKSTNIIPSHVELRSLFAPKLGEYIRIFKGWDSFKAALEREGLKPKFSIDSPELKQGQVKFFVDTREQMPLKMENCTTKKLIVGDYCPDGDFFSNVFVERKSLFDFAGTLSKGFDRFKGEVQRAKDIGAYLIVVTESNFSDAFEYSPQNSFSQRIGGAYLFNKVRELMLDFDNIQFVFSSNRLRSAQLIENIFRLEGEARNVDLEYLKDQGKI